MELTYKAAGNILQILEGMLTIDRLPLKFCITKNVKSLKKLLEPYDEKKQAAFMKSVKVTESGSPVLKPASSIENGHAHYNSFEYQSSEAYGEFVNELLELNTVLVEFDFIVASQGRIVKVSNKDGSYEDITVADILEDPNSGITGQQVDVLLEYILVD